MKRLITVIIAAHVLAAPCCWVQAGTVSVEWDAVEYTEPVTYEIEGINATTALTSAIVPVADCQETAVKVRAVVGEDVSEWSTPLVAWPDITVTTITPTEVRLGDGQVIITIEGTQLNATGLKVQAGNPGDPEWADMTFSIGVVDCNTIVGTLNLPPTQKSIDLWIIHEGQKVLAGTVVATVEVIPAPTNLRVVR